VTGGLGEILIGNLVRLGANRPPLLLTELQAKAIDRQYHHAIIARIAEAFSVIK
jgi:hypothetical protein